MSTDDPEKRMGERAGVNRATFWLFVDAPRWAVAVAVLAVIALTVSVAGAVGRPLSGDPVETLFQALVGATVTGVTLVVTINQVVLSQELGAVGDQRERLSAATEFRRDAEAVFDGVAPTDPATFLAALLEAVEDHLATARAGTSDDRREAEAAVTRLAERTTTSATTVRDRLDGATFGSFAVTRAALDFDYSGHITQTRRVRASHDFSAAVDEALAETVETLELYGVAREHVKTLYFQRSLIDLSRSILVTAVPALAVGIGTMLYYTPGDGTTTHLVIGLGTAAVLSPFAVLLAYVARIATVMGRTLAIGPFTLRREEGADG